MSQIKLKHSGGNGVIIAAPDSNPASDRTLKLPSDVNSPIDTLNRAGNILQAVSTTKTDVSSAYLGSGGYFDTGLSASITPSSSSNKILIYGYIMISVVGPQHNIGVAIRKDSSILTAYQGDEVGNRRQVAAVGTNMVSTYENFIGQINFQYTDTAGGTSAITYQAVGRNPSSTSRTCYLNRATTDTDSSNHYRTASTITVMEIAV